MTITITDEARSIVRMHVDGIPAVTLRGLLLSSSHGPYTEYQIDDALACLLSDGFAFIDTVGRWHQTPYAAAAERYEMARLLRPRPVRDFLLRCFGRWAWKLWLLAALLLTTVASCMAMAQG